MKVKENRKAGSFNWAIIREALRRSIPPDEVKHGRRSVSLKKHDAEITVLINDVFGGEMLKTYTRRGWHFYNRVDGECIDLSLHEPVLYSDSYGSEEDNVTPSGTVNRFDRNDYTKLFTRFVRALEEAVGLGRYQSA